MRSLSLAVLCLSLKPSSDAEGEDSSCLAEVWTTLHVVDGGNPPGTQEAEMKFQLFISAAEKNKAVTIWLSMDLRLVLSWRCISHVHGKETFWVPDYEGDLSMW